ncbi:hypothetical protein K9M79_06815 [Candidatus Woesearchaeota archaeon]|nr:hypothetical protein [Candidatus Woesearchaeota archaeon]
MKRIIAAMMTLVFIIVLLAGCADFVGPKLCHFVIKEYNYATDQFEEKWLQISSETELTEKQVENIGEKIQKTEIVNLECD